MREGIAPSPVNNSIMLSILFPINNQNLLPYSPSPDSFSTLL